VTRQAHPIGDLHTAEDKLSAPAEAMHVETMSNAKFSRHFQACWVLCEEVTIAEASRATPQPKPKQANHHDDREACLEQRRREYEVKKLKCKNFRILRILRPAAQSHSGAVAFGRRVVRFVVTRYFLLIQHF
jgi:hypothetical protein